MDTIKKDTIILSLRQVSACIAIFLMSCFTCFALGYFFGQSAHLASFIESASRESIANEICTSLYCKKNPTSGINELNENEDVIESEPIKESTTVEPLSECIRAVSIESTPETAIERSESDSTLIIPQENNRYYAPLIGYGTQKAADQFIQKWKKQGIALVLKKHISRNSKNKQITWYQVISPEFTNKTDLENIVDIISKREHLKNIKIVKI